MIVPTKLEAVVHQCMADDPRRIRYMLDVLWAIKALERIGDHSANISEYVVYFVRGKDVRYSAVEALRQEIANKPQPS